MRISPYGAAGDVLPSYEGVDETYYELAKGLSRLGILYLHLVDHSSMGAPAVPQSIKSGLRKHFDGTLILTGGYTEEKAESDLEADHADLIGFGRPFISNPDLVERMKNKEALSPYDMNTFYSPGAEGYTTYPALAEKVG